MGEEMRRIEDSPRFDLLHGKSEVNMTGEEIAPPVKSAWGVLDSVDVSGQCAQRSADVRSPSLKASNTGPALCKVASLLGIPRASAKEAKIGVMLLRKMPVSMKGKVQAPIAGVQEKETGRLPLNPPGKNDPAI